MNGGVKKNKHNTPNSGADGEDRTSTSKRPNNHYFLLKILTGKHRYDYK